MVEGKLDPKDEGPSSSSVGARTILCWMSHSDGFLSEG